MTATHLYSVGQPVRLKGSFGQQSQFADIYHITDTLPPSGGSPQYRIRNEDERYERVTKQDSLEPVSASQSGDLATLFEKTFGNSQGMKVRRSRD